jgi:hypothetical protein
MVSAIRDLPMPGSPESRTTEPSPPFGYSQRRRACASRLREQRLRGGECPAFDAVVRQQPRHALQKARVVIDHDHNCRRCHIRLQPHIRVQPRGGNVPNGGGRPLIWIKEI